MLSLHIIIKELNTKTMEQDNRDPKNEGMGEDLKGFIPDVLNTLLCDDNIAKMACEYTESESEYQAFILACQVIAEKMQLGCRRLKARVS